MRLRALDRGLVKILLAHAMGIVGEPVCQRQFTCSRCRRRVETLRTDQIRPNGSAAALALRRKKVRRGSSMCVPPKVVRHADRPLPDSISKSRRAKSPECLLVGPLTLRVDRAMSTAAIKWQG